MTQPEPAAPGPPWRDDPRRHAYYGGRKKGGDDCGGFVVAGTETCRMHGGKKLTQLKAEGAVVMEVRKWGLGDTAVDPGEVLLRLVTQSAARVDLYSALLQQAYEAAERLYAADDLDPAAAVDASEAARRDLARVLQHGGVAALIGHTYAATKEGDAVATGEALRGLVQLEAAERDRCAGFAAKAIAAGLAERQVRIAERNGAAIAGLIRRVVAALDLPPEKDAMVPALVAKELQALTGAPVIEGEAAA